MADRPNHRRRRPTHRPSGRPPGGWRGRQPPPWWPSGEPWPPERPPWHWAPRRFRRRFLLAAVVLIAALVGVGMMISLITGDWDRDWRGPPADERPSAEEQERRPGGLIIIVGGILVVGGIATALAYRRISRPVGDLLGAAGQVAEGDYNVALKPDGPRELRLLTATFNDMAARLAATDEQRRRFLADVTHELRTPLSVLQSEVEAQLDGIHPRDDRHLGSLLEEIQRLGQLVEDLHALALAEAGRIVLHRELASPAALVEEAVEAHTALAAQNDVDVRLSVSTSGVPDVEVDTTRIRQVLDNLLSNAVRHTPAGSQVLVQVEPAHPPEEATTPEAAASESSRRQAESELPGHVRFTVTDAGPGFPPDQIDQVFERFVRSADSSGSGLGLSIARDLVRAHGGTIQAGNDPATGGGVVSFTLPRTRLTSG